jgi:2-enoate reductase
MNNYSRLFETVKIGKVTLKNRLAMAPMGINGFWGPAYTVNQQGIDYYLQRAKGGVGLIITGAFKVENEVEPDNNRLPRVNANLISALAEICNVSHSLGTKVFIQLSAGWGRVSRNVHSSHLPVSASRVPCFWDPRIITRALTMEEVEKIVHAFGNAAKIVSAAGADGIELHGHEGYLFDQFTTALWNHRRDKYGGDLKRRLTFPLEVLSEIKKNAGTDFPVQYRMGLKHYIKSLNAGALPGESFTEAGQDIEQGLKMARLLEEAGFSSLHVDAGCYDSWYWAHPPTYQERGCMVDMAARVKKIVKIPVMAVGRMDNPELAEQIVENGQADLVALGRGLLADPDWVNKVQENKVDLIRPCIGCHEGCMGRLSSGKPLSCTVNPACGREIAYSLTPSKQVKRILVVGGGVAGMEAARAAANRGHRVTLHEKEKALGGHLLEASIPDFKMDLRRLLQWYEKQLSNSSVIVRLNSPVTLEIIRRENPEVILVATGSKPVSSELLKKNDSKVITAIDVLSGKKKTGQNILIVGGGLIGCEVSLWLAKQGKKITLVEALPELMNQGIAVPHMNRLMLLDMLAFFHVEVLTQTKLGGIEGGNAILERNSHQEALQIDNIVLAIGLEPEDGLFHQIKGEFTQIFKLGDCRKSGNVMEAIWNAYDIARKI